MATVYRSHILEALFRRPVVAYVNRGVSDVGAIHEDEALSVSDAAEPRQQDFASGRLAASSALKGLGIEGWPILSNQDRAPVWPDSVAGSITHTQGFCAAVVASKLAYSGIGIDAEGRSNVSCGLWEQVLTAAERRRMSSLPGPHRCEIATAMFSAKESFFKCQYQLTGSWLGFDDAEVRLRERSFVIHLMQDVGPLRSGDTFVGRYILLPTVVVTGIGIASEA